MVEGCPRHPIWPLGCKLRRERTEVSLVATLRIIISACALGSNELSGHVLQFDHFPQIHLLKSIKCLVFLTLLYAALALLNTSTA